MANNIYLGIISPCSTCKNQRSAPDPIAGLPSCPRRMAKQELVSAPNIIDNFGRLALSTLTGNEDTQSNSTQLVNPVYSDSNNTALVWVALLKDNIAIYDNDGNLKNPDILDSGFDTNYICCHSDPVVPTVQEAQYRASGAWSESDLVQITLTGYQQQKLDSTGSGTYDILNVNGFATKVNFPMSNPRSKVERDHSVPGV